MKQRFAFFTWLLALGLSIIVSTFLAYYLGIISTEFVGIFVAVAFFSIFFSLPGLAGIFFWLWVADEFIYLPQEKFICLCIGCILTTFLCYTIIYFTFGVELTDPKILPLIPASILSVLTALILQRKHFYKLISTSPYE